MFAEDKDPPKPLAWRAFCRVDHEMSMKFPMKGPRRYIPKHVGKCIISVLVLQGGPFEFDQFSVQFNSFYGASGAISFAGTWPNNQSRYKLTMVPQQSTVQVTALADSLTMSTDQSADMVLGAAAGVTSHVHSILLHCCSTPCCSTACCS